MTRDNPFMHCEAKIISLLDRQCAALRSGDYHSAALLSDDVTKAFAEIEQLPLTVAQKPYAEAAVTRLRAAATRTGALFQAAREGVVSAKRTVARLRAEATSTGAYGAQGEPVPSQAAPSAERRV